MRIRKMSLLLLLLLLLVLCLCISWEIPIFQLIIFGIYICSVYLLLTLSTCKFFAGDPHGKFGARAPFFFFLSAPVIRVKYESRFMIFILFLLLVQLLVRIQEERLLLLLLLF